MATALARAEMVDGDGSSLTLRLHVAFSGAEVNGGQGWIDYVSVPLSADDQPAAIRSKMSAAVSAFATAQGWTVTGGNMTLPTFQKG